MYELFQAVGGWIVPVLLAAVAIFTWVLTRNAAIYANFDTMYQKMLDIGLEHPELRNPEKTANYKQHFKDDALVRYETYAYMVFNICETIADSLDLYPGRSNRVLDKLECRFCRFLPFVADRQWLKKTWQPVLGFENNLHRDWLKDQKGGQGFKQEFLDLLGTL